jgi:hypothetical protein
MVVDKNGVEIKPGQTVLVHQDEGVRKAVVHKPFPDSPTVNTKGHWVDVSIEGLGLEGMMSYVLEVTNDPNYQWRPATMGDIGSIARFFDNDDSTMFSYGILREIRKVVVDDETRLIYVATLGLFDEDSTDRQCCQIQYDANKEP